MSHHIPWCLLIRGYKGDVRRSVLIRTFGNKQEGFMHLTRACQGVWGDQPCSHFIASPGNAATPSKHLHRSHHDSTVSLGLKTDACAFTTSSSEKERREIVPTGTFSVYLTEVNHQWKTSGVCKRVEGHFQHAAIYQHTVHMAPRGGGGGALNDKDAEGARGRGLGHGGLDLGPWGWVRAAWPLVRRVVNSQPKPFSICRVQG